MIHFVLAAISAILPPVTLTHPIQNFHLNHLRRKFSPKFKNMEMLDRVKALKAELDSMRPLDAEAEERIMQKFRLDWNFHSNKLEGNSLTSGETNALVLFGITAPGKPLNDHFKVAGHNDAVNWILDLLKSGDDISEEMICQLHSLLLKESKFKEAISLNGEPTENAIEVGTYKSQRNHVVTITGETFYFAEPEETPAKIRELVEAFHEEAAKDGIDPVILATLFHYRFIRIHPFDDGNGRVARLLMNFILMKFGYPPIVIKTDDKENYYAVLRLADAGDPEPFIEYIAENLANSLGIMLRGARGEDLEEPEDFDKELALIELQLRSVGKKIERVRSGDLVRDVFKRSIEPLANEFFAQFSAFDKFYLEKHATISINGNELLGEYEDALIDAGRRLENADDDAVSEIAMNYICSEFNQLGLGKFDTVSTITVAFERTRFTVANTRGEVVLEKLYTERIEADEAIAIIRSEKNRHLKMIKRKIEQARHIGKHFAPAAAETIGSSMLAF